jgi:preprotein translocase subunit SecY
MGVPLLDRWIGRLLVGPEGFRGTVLAQGQVTLRQRWLVTGIGLAAFHILQRLPGIDVSPEQVQEALAANPLLALISLFTGGDLLQTFSLAATGVFPYLMALALVSLILSLRPQLREALEARGGESARERLELLLTVLLAFLFAYGLATLLSRPVGLVPAGLSWFTASRFLESLRLVALLTLGGVLSAAIARLITTWGIYRGEGVILLVGTSLRLLGQAGTLQRPPAAVLQQPGMVAVVGAGALALAGLSWLLATRSTSVPIVGGSSKGSGAGGRSAGATTPSIPFLYNATGIQPLAGALGLLSLLSAFAGALRSLAEAMPAGSGRSVATGMAALLDGAGPGRGPYWIGLALLVALFTWAGNLALLWDPPVGQGPLWDQLKRQGLFIPGVRPGHQTQRYLERRMQAISQWGAGGMVLLGAGLPWLVWTLTAVNLSGFAMEIHVFAQTLTGCLQAIRARRRSSSWSWGSKR